MNQDFYRLMVARMGGYESPIITTTDSNVTLPAGCIALLPNSGCIFTSITTDEDAHNHADATHMNLLLKDVGDTSTYAAAPILCKSPYFFTHAQISAGSFKAILI
jgi:hypothetical protein